MSEGQTCYERDEVLCDDQMCLHTGCRIRNERMTADAALLRAIPRVTVWDAGEHEGCGKDSERAFRGDYHDGERG